jgi:hypothetical protein
MSLVPEHDSLKSLHAFIEGLAINKDVPVNFARKLLNEAKNRINSLSNEHAYMSRTLQDWHANTETAREMAKPHLPEIDDHIGFTNIPEIVNRLCAKLKIAKNASDAMYMDMVGLAKKMGKGGGREGMTYGYVHHEVQKAVGELLRKTGEVVPEGYEFCEWPEDGIGSVLTNGKVIRYNLAHSEATKEAMICMGCKPVRRIGAVEEVTEDKTARKKPGPKPKYKGEDGQS